LHEQRKVLTYKYAQAFVIHLYYFFAKRVEFVIRMLERIHLNAEAAHGCYISSEFVHYILHIVRFTAFSGVGCQPIGEILGTPKHCLEHQLHLAGRIGRTEDLPHHAPVVSILIKQIPADYLLDFVVHEIAMIAEVIEILDGNSIDQIWITYYVDRCRELVKTKVLHIRKQIVHPTNIFGY